MKPRGAIATSYFVLLGLLGAMGPYLTKEFESRDLEYFSLFLSMPALVGLFVTPIWGMMADLFPNIRLWMGLATVLVIGGVMGLINVQGPAIYACMFLYALGRAPLSPLLDAITLEIVQKDYGSLRLWGSIGFTVIMVICSLLDENLGLSSLYIALALGGFLLLLVFQLPIPQRVQSENIFSQLPVVLQNRELVCLLLASALHFSSHAANTSYLAMYIESLNASTLWTGAAITGGIVVEVLVLAYSSKLLVRYSPHFLFMVAAFIAFFRWILMYFALSGWWVFLCQLSHGLTFGLFWIAVVSWIERISPAELKNTGQSLLGASVGGVGVALGIFLATRVVESSGLRDIYVLNIFFGFLTLLALGYTWRLSSRNEQQHSL
ncbi:MAG: hypothetical protein CL916_08660 [Deltaproteobacteria bacterium]|nr:hypothetical protein [Deltaproteobacteria bacterium]